VSEGQTRPQNDLKFLLFRVRLQGCEREVGRESGREMIDRERDMEKFISSSGTYGYINIGKHMIGNEIL
jgi:hypothetical protein